jgi:hypothetical protein
MRRLVPGVFALALVIATTGAASAQTPASPAAQRPSGPRLDVATTLSLVGPTSFGQSAEQLLRPDGSNLTVFRADNRLAAGIGVEVHLGFPARRRLMAELTGSWSRADLQSRISGDIEDVEDVTLGQRLHRFSAEGSVVWTWRARGRASYFVRGGAGWMRELVADGLLTADAVVTNVGAGMKYWWRERPRASVRRIGLRLEGRANVRSSGLSLDQSSRHVAPVLSGGLIFGF